MNELPPDFFDDAPQNIPIKKGIPKQKWEALVKAIEVIEGRVYRDDEMLKMFDISVQMDGNTRLDTVYYKNKLIVQFKQTGNNLTILELYEG